MHAIVWFLTGAAGAALLFGLLQRSARTTLGAVSHAPVLAHTAQGLEAGIARLGEFERHILSHVVHRQPVARDTNLEFEKRLTLGERMADRLSNFGGSWTFLGIFAAILLVWIGYNVERPGSFDPFPFILLNLVLSCLAAVQAPVILMSQNRMSAKDRIDARHDYEVNLKAEMEVMGLHVKLDDLQQREWGRLLEIQERQIEALARIESALAARLDAGD
jgi:uncharacterized membrane protein